MHSLALKQALQVLKPRLQNSMPFFSQSLTKGKWYGVEIDEGWELTLSGATVSPEVVSFSALRILVRIGDEPEHETHCICRLHDGMNFSTLSQSFDQEDTFVSFSLSHDGPPLENILSLTGYWRRSNLSSTVSERGIKRKCSVREGDWSGVTPLTKFSGSIESESGKSPSWSSSSVPSASETSERTKSLEEKASDIEPFKVITFKASALDVVVDLPVWRNSLMFEEGGNVIKSQTSVKKSHGLTFTEQIVGTGPEPRDGAVVKVLYEGVYPNSGIIFDSKCDVRHPLVFRKGLRQVQLIAESLIIRQFVPNRCNRLCRSFRGWIWVWRVCESAVNARYSCHLR